VHSVFFRPLKTYYYLDSTTEKNELKAVRFHEYGSPDVLKYEEVETPTLEKGQVLLKVRSCGVNRFDTKIRAGAFKTYLPHILGTDFAGEVTEVAEGVVTAKPGDRVVVYHILNDDSCLNCLSGRQNICDHSHMIGAFADGGYAERMRVSASNVLDIGELDFRTAACLPMNFATAWNGLVSKAQIGADDTVLVWGAGSGLGSAAIKIAKLFGARVIATAGSADKLDKAVEIGADDTINYSTEKVSSRVMALTNNNGVTIAFDHIGNGGWTESIDSLTKGGTLVALGVTGGAKTEVEVSKVYHKELRFCGVYGCSKGDMKSVILLANEGRLKPVIYREMPLEEAAEAHRIVESGSKFGKILLTP
jgi:NADPH:quinone reductase-like Zn-dependent oxidoreductase